jgi:transglutaminase-like putative cysteine protease
LTDQRYGNKVLLLSLEPKDSGKELTLLFRVQRKEKGPYRDSGSQPEEFLAPEQLVPNSDEFSAAASEVVAGKQGDLVKARALYDHTIDRMRYMKYGPGWGQGDAAYACDSGTGNCSDFHSYYIAVLRAAGIPARFAVGASIPSERHDGGIDGYHCWAEFYAEDKWWPVDISEADKYSALSTYYFGHHPANRIELSRGRDLVVEPGPASGPINFLAYPVLEVDGKPVAVKPQFSFRRLGERVSEHSRTGTGSQATSN